jgi:hypothetical protein
MGCGRLALEHSVKRAGDGAQGSGLSQPDDPLASRIDPAQSLGPAEDRQ